MKAPRSFDPIAKPSVANHDPQTKNCRNIMMLRRVSTAWGFASGLGIGLGSLEIGEGNPS
jgi:hypothetical protein